MFDIFSLNKKRRGIQIFIDIAIHFRNFF